MLHFTRIIGARPAPHRELQLLLLVRSHQRPTGIGSRLLRLPQQLILMVQIQHARGISRLLLQIVIARLHQGFSDEGIFGGRGPRQRRGRPGLGVQEAGGQSGAEFGGVGHAGGCLRLPRVLCKSGSRDVEKAKEWIFRSCPSRAQSLQSSHACAHPSSLGARRSPRRRGLPPLGARRQLDR